MLYLRFFIILEFHGWMPLFKDIMNAFVDSVIEFYVNLKQLPNMSIGSNIFGIEISLSISYVASFLSVPSHEFDRYDGDGWPTIIGITA